MQKDLELFESFILDVGYYVEKSKSLDFENSQLKADLEQSNTENVVQQNKIVLLNKRITELLGVSERASVRTTETLTNLVKETKIVDQTVSKQVLIYSFFPVLMQGGFSFPPYRFACVSSWIELNWRRVTCSVT